MWDRYWTVRWDSSLGHQRRRVLPGCSSGNWRCKSWDHLESVFKVEAMFPWGFSQPHHMFFDRFLPTKQTAIVANMKTAGNAIHYGPSIKLFFYCCCLSQCIINTKGRRLHQMGGTSSCAPILVPSPPQLTQHISVYVRHPQLQGYLACVSVYRNAIPSKASRYLPNFVAPSFNSPHLGRQYW